MSSGHSTREFVGHGGAPMSLGWIALLALLGLFGLGGPWKGEPSESDEQRPLRGTAVSPADVTPAVAVLSDYLNIKPPKEGTEEKAIPLTGSAVLREFLGLRSTTAYSPNVVHADWFQNVMRTRDPKMRWLIATVPDPIDSHLQLTTDNAISAIECGFQRHNFVLDRYQLPWTDELRQRAANGTDSNGDKPSAQSPYRTRPGAILFRAADQLVMVLLVGETPTSGIHKPAMKEALDLVWSWNCMRDDPSRTIRILGPEFSGSSSSLRMQLLQWGKELPAQLLRRTINIDVVSGSATADKNADILNHPRSLEDRPKNVRLTFRATILPDSVTVARLLNHLQEKQGIPPGKILFLKEGNTAYGASYMPDAQPADPKPRIMPYPLSVGRIRSEYEPTDREPQHQRQTYAERRKNLDLSLELPPYAIDVLPTYSDATLALTDVTIEQILTTIVRDRIQAVGLFGTDVRDKLILAQLIRRHAPDVQLFTIETSLLYTHASYTRALKGMIVASTYPLFSRNQEWTSGGDPRLTLPSDTAQGIYNATIAILNKEFQKHHELLEYSAPFSNTRRPPLWLTMVGDTSLWPINMERLAELKRIKKYTYAASKASVGQPHETQFLVRTPSVIPMALSSLVSIWAAIAFICVNCSWRPASNVPADGRRKACRFEVLQRWGRRCFPYFSLSAHTQAARVKRWAALLALFTGLAAIHVAILSPARAMSVLARGTDWLDLGVLAAYVLTPLLFAGVVITAASYGFTNQAKVDRTTVRYGRDFWPLPVSIVICLLTAGCLIWWLWPFWGQTDPINAAEEAKLAIFVERVGTFSSGVTPVMPLILIISAICFWAIAEMRRTYYSSIYELQSPFPKETVNRHVAGVPQRVQNLQDHLNDTHSLPTEPIDWLFIVLLFVGIYYCLFERWIGTVEGPVFDLLFQGLTVVALTCFAGLFMRLRSCCGLFERLLRRLGQHAMAPAFKRVPETLKIKVSQNVFAVMPHPGDMDMQVRWHNLLEHCVVKEERGSAEPIDWPARHEDLPGMIAVREGPPISKVHAATETADYGLEKKFAQLMCYDRSEQARTYREAAELNKQLAEHAQKIVPQLYNYWNRVDNEADSDNGKHQQTQGDHNGKQAGKSWEEEAEDFVAIHFVNLIRQVFAHIQNMMTFLVLMFLCILFCLDSYPFQPHHRLLALCFGLLIWVSAYMFIAILKFNRNQVLSHLSNTIPEKFTFDRSLVLPLLAYVVVPLVSLLIVRFPTLDEFFFGWTAWLR